MKRFQSIMFLGGFALAAGCVDTGESVDRGAAADEQPTAAARSGLTPNNLVVNGGFEAPVAAAHSTVLATTIPGWSLALGPAIEVQNNAAGAAVEGSQVVELDSYASSAIYQDIPTTPGASYIVSLAFSPRPGYGLNQNVLGISWNGQQVAQLKASGLGLSSTQWTYYTATLTATGPSTRLQLADLGISDSAGTLVDDVSVVPVVPPTCVTLQRGQSGALGNVQDSIIAFDPNDPNQGTPLARANKNYGTSQGITADIVSGVIRQSLVQWDLSAVPAGSFITSASASLTAGMIDASPVTVYRATAPWSEGTVTYNTFNHAYASNAPLATFPAVAPGTVTTASLTGLVQGWTDGAYPVDGVLISSDMYPGSMQFNSSEASAATARPKLDVCYIPGPCAAQPCQNGGVCNTTGLTTYTCTCPAGYTGTNCQTPPPPSCAAILAANPGAADGPYTIDPDGPGGFAPVTTYCDMTNGGYTLVASAWIPAYAASVPAQYAALGQFVLPHDIGISFSAVRLACQSTTTAADRTRAFGAASTDLDTMANAATETYGPTDNLARPSSTACYQGYAEWHGLNGGCGGRYIVRVDEVHCGLDYQSLPGGGTNNPALGEWGQIWAR